MGSWSIFWGKYGFPTALILGQSLLTLVALLLFIAYILLADRKIWAAVQLRRGPNVVGAFGLLQSFADFIKFVLKEPIIPAGADKTVFRHPSGQSNGLTLDTEGRLVVCEGGNRRVTRTEHDGTISVLAETYLGRKLNSPNDVAVRSDGTIFFTDPPYGVEKEKRELPFSGVYCIAPGGEVKLLSVYFEFPNGLAFSPDEKTLYVGDSDAGFIEAFEVAKDGRLRNFQGIQKAGKGIRLQVKVGVRRQRRAPVPRSSRKGSISLPVLHLSGLLHRENRT